MPTYPEKLPLVFLQIAEFPKPDFMSKSLEELKIGTYENIAMVQTNTPIYVALGIFVQHRVSALPVVDDSGERPCRCSSGNYGLKAFVFFKSIISSLESLGCTG